MAWSSGVCVCGGVLFVTVREDRFHVNVNICTHVTCLFLAAFLRCYYPHIRNVRQIPHSSFILDSPPPSAFLSFSVTGCSGSHFQPACRR